MELPEGNHDRAWSRVGLVELDEFSDGGFLGVGFEPGECGAIHGYDILFTASDGVTKLNHEIEQYVGSRAIGGVGTDTQSVADGRHRDLHVLRERLGGKSAESDGGLIAIPNATQPGSSGIQYAYANWSDLGGESHTIVVPGAATTYTANFTIQYHLTMTRPGTYIPTETPYGTVFPASGWLPDRRIART